MLNISHNTVSWVFKNVVISIETIVMDVLMTLVKWEQTLPLLCQVNISRNTVSWWFENVVILMATMVMEDLMTLVKWEQIFSLFNQA